MKLSTRARYGVRLMLELALYYGKGILDLKDIARNEEISEKYLSQIIIPLRRAGLVRSQRGNRGGYVLAKPPERITVRDIVEVLEGKVALVECASNRMCRRANICVTQNIWRDLGDMIQRELGKITLQELARRHQEKNSGAAMYNI